MTPRRNPPGRPRDPSADQAILRAAIDLLIERGIDGTSVEQIAKRAGVAKLTVYRRWESKEDLLAQAIESIRDEIPAVDLDAPSSGGLPELIEEMLPRWGVLVAEPRFGAVFARLVGAGRGHPRLTQLYWHHHVRPRRELARAVMERAQTAGTLDPSADLDILLDMLWGAVLQRLLVEPGPHHPAELTDYLRRLLRQCGFTLMASEGPVHRERDSAASPKDPNRVESHAERKTDRGDDRLPGHRR